MKRHTKKGYYLSMVYLEHMIFFWLARTSCLVLILCRLRTIQIEISENTQYFEMMAAWSSLIHDIFIMYSIYQKSSCRWKEPKRLSMLSTLVEQWDYFISWYLDGYLVRANRNSSNVRRKNPKKKLTFWQRAKLYTETTWQHGQ